MEKTQKEKLIEKASKQLVILNGLISEDGASEIATKLTRDLGVVGMFELSVNMLAVAQILEEIKGLDIEDIAYDLLKSNIENFNKTAKELKQLVK